MVSGSRRTLSDIAMLIVYEVRAMSLNPIEKCLEMICYLPRIFSTQNRSVLDIYNESDYEKVYQSISLELIFNKVKSDSSIVDDWVLYTLNKRCTPSWGLFEGKFGIWSISYILDTGKPSKTKYFRSKLLACAEMIKYEMEDLRLRN